MATDSRSPVSRASALLPSPCGASDAEGSAEQPVPAWRHLSVVLAYTIFAVLLLYASGATVLAAILLQQLGLLPASNQVLLALFPLAFGGVHVEADGSVDFFSHDYLGISIGWFLLSIIWEALMICCILPQAWRPKHGYRINDTIASLSNGVLYTLCANLYFVQWGSPLAELIYRHCRLTSVFEDPANPAAFWLSLVLHDAFYYFGHRTSHYFSWLWMAHVVHHGCEDFNLAAALRQPFNEFMTPSSIVFGAPLALLFPSRLLAFQGIFGLLYQFWIHTQLVPPLPRVELLLNTPSLHRVHHARNLRALGKNYGSIFSVWDRIGGTFESELGDDEPLQYGIIPPLASWNPVWANFSHLHFMAMRQWRWHGWKTPFKHWTPPSGRCPPLGSRLNPFTKYDPFPKARALQVYVIMQFLLVAGVFAIGPIMVDFPTAWTRVELGVVRGVSFLLAAWSVGDIAAMESATTAKGLRLIFFLEGLRHAAFMAAAVLVWQLLLQGAASPVFFAAVVAYGALHACWIARLLVVSRRASRGVQDHS